MGNEATCTAHFGKKKLTGKALLETSEVLFRPADGSPRLKIPFSAIKSAKTVDGRLHLQTTDGPTIFELGPTADKWCHKILHPKTRAEKIGIKPGIKVSLLGESDREFTKELRAATKNIHESKLDPDSDLVFLTVDSLSALASEITKVAKAIKGATAALWIVYPKGKKEITENDVLSAGRKTGLKDVKVVGFSATHTALKFVLPLNKR
jgi:hypothetical protein